MNATDRLPQQRESRSGQPDEGRILGSGGQKAVAELRNLDRSAGSHEGSKPARADLASNLSEGITIHLDPATLGRLRSRAGDIGIGTTTLARMWIVERLRGTDRRGHHMSHTS